MSSKSNDGDDWLRGFSDSISNITNAYIFIESLKSEDCVAILCSCMEKLKEEMKKVLQMYGKPKDSQIKGKSQVNSWSEAMDFITIKLEEYEREQQEKYKIIGSIKSEMVNMNK